MSEKKNIQDYYFKAQTADEKRVICALLGIAEVPFAFEQRSDMEYNCIWVEGGSGVTFTENHSMTEVLNFATIDQLLKWACNGFDFREPWEVPEDGFRIVTGQERHENEYPLDCNVFWFDGDMTEWYRSLNSASWRDLSNDECKAFAVPADYQFGPKEVSVNQIMELCGDLLKEKFGDNFVVKGVE